MVQAVKITSLNDIGTSIMYTTLVPVVNMTGTPTTEKANLQIVGNLILNGAGGSYFPPAAQATVSQFVAYAAQPNITSVGTLTSLNVSGNINAGNANLGNLAIANVFSGTLNGSAVSANIANTVAVNAQPNITSVGTLTALNVTGSANLGSVTNLIITGGSPNYVLQTNGTGNLSWVAQSGGGGNTGNITFTAANISTNIANRDIQIIGNGTGNVNVISNSQVWTFDADGNLNIPSNQGSIGTVYSDGIDIIAPVGGYSELASGNLDNFVYVEDNGVYINTNRTDTEYQWHFDTTGNLTLPDSASIIAAATITLEANSTGNTTGLGLNGDADAFLYAHANIIINTDVNGTDNIWTFDKNGNLTLPTAGALTLDGVGLRSSGSIGQLFSQSGTLAVCSITAGVQILADNGDHTWQFGSGGALTFPSYTYAQGNIDGFNNFGFSMPAGNGFAILANTGNSQWTFSSDGNLVLPGTGTINNQTNSSLDPTTPTASTMVLTPDSNYLYQALVLDPTSPGHIHLRSPATSGGNIDQPTANIFLGGELSSFEVGASYGGTPNVFIHSGGNTWTFGTDGNLTTPGVAGNITGANVISANTFVILGNTELGQIEGPNTAGFYNANAIDFLFELGTTNTWAFIGNTGGTLFPTITVQRGDTVDTITGQTLLFSDSTQEAIISTPNGDTNTNSSQRLVINPGEGYQGGEGGDIYLWAGRGGDASGSGGDIKIRGGLGGGNANGGTGGDGGYIRMEAGPGQGTGAAGWIEITSGAGGTGQNGGYVRILSGQGAINGGDANLTGGTGTAGVGGTVNIVGGASGLGLPDYGNVNIISGASTWRFDNTGNLTLPGEGIIKSNNDTVTLESYDVANTTSYGMYVGTTGGAYFFQGANPNWLSINPNLGNAEIYSGPGVSGGAGKNLSIAAGFADQGSFNTSPGGNLNLVAGLGGSNDGGGGGPGGSVNIAAGNSADPAGHAGNITINSGIDTWTFDYTGNLTTPGSIITAGSGGNITLTGGDITGVNIIVTTPTVLANLTAIAGARAFITDGNLVAAGGGSFGAQIGGGGSNICPVWSDGTNWYVG
jgi:hypothetical protein